MPPSLLADLNPAQRDAVVGDGGALVLAGAGTGKTRVLVGRVAHLLQQQLAQPRDILAVTFTNKAAREMRERVAAAVNQNIGDLLVGTFHSACHRMLRVHARHANLPRDFQILDSQDQLNFIRRTLREHDINEDDFPPAEVRAYINAAKEAALRANAVPTPSARARQMAEIYARYETAARKEGRVDFAELLLAAAELLRENQTLRAHYANRFRHILIDEFQDTNKLQYDWLKLLDSGTNHFFAVGDDDQSIYAFRGAEPGVMQKFQRDFRAEKIVRLERNYRSTANILAAANGLIARNTSRLGKTLRAASETDGARAMIIRAPRADDEAAAVAAIINRKRDDGADLNAVAVLYRMNAQSRLLERKLTEAGIPYRIYGGLRFFERMEVKNALAYVRLAVADDDDAFRRAVNAPPRGIGPRALENLRATPRPTLCAAAWESDIPKVANFAALIRELRDIRETGGLAALAKATAEKTGLLEYLESRPKERDRADNLREFAAAAAEFEREYNESVPAKNNADRGLHNADRGLHNAGRGLNPRPERSTPIKPSSRCSSVGTHDSDAPASDSSIPETESDLPDATLAFLSNAALEAGDERPEGASAVAVNLMTAHSAKGLEFDAVFVAGLEEGVFPHARSLESGDRSAVEEERRLMYVAMTRARRELFLCLADERQLYGGVSRNPPSRFLDEIPPERLANPESLKPSPASGRGGWERSGWESRRRDIPKWSEQLPAVGGVRSEDAKGVGGKAVAVATGSDAKGVSGVAAVGKFRPGQVVRHSRYGRGVVVGQSGTGKSAEIKVAFKSAGVRTFKSALAKLTPENS